MNSLVAACEDCLEYPQNLKWANHYAAQLKTLRHRLSIDESRLFHSESKAKVEIRDYDKNAFSSVTACNILEMREKLGIADGSIPKMPKCRFIFCRSLHSRERFKMTREIFTLALSLHQVMPDFLEYIYPFGLREQREDFCFSSFRSQCQLTGPTTDVPHPGIGTSGRIQLCYNIKLVERTTYQQDWPWALRQCAVHHSFDIEKSQANWIILEANSRFSKTIASSTGSDGLAKLKALDTITEAYTAALATHLIFWEGAIEDWRWYTNFLERQCDGITGALLGRDVKVFDKTLAEGMNVASLMFRHGISSGSQNPDRSPSSKRQSGTECDTSHHQENYLSLANSALNFDRTGQGSQEVCPDNLEKERLQNSNTSQLGSYGVDEVTFEDVQRTQHVEEAVREASLIISLNARTIDRLIFFYSSLEAEPGWPSEIAEGCKATLQEFSRCLRNLENDCEIQKIRCETISKLLADRKALAHSILDIQSSKRMAFDSQLMSVHARLSADRMEAMTKNMNQIAQKTKLETVSMRIVTLVTLFFLPGTYISTLMSTDIIRFEKTDGKPSQSVFQMKALQLYLAISIPLVVATLSLSYLFYRWEIRHDVDKSTLDPKRHTCR